MKKIYKTLGVIAVTIITFVACSNGGSEKKEFSAEEKLQYLNSAAIKIGNNYCDCIATETEKEVVADSSCDTKMTNAIVDAIMNEKLAVSTANQDKADKENQTKLFQLVKENVEKTCLTEGENEK